MRGEKEKMERCWEKKCQGGAGRSTETKRPPPKRETKKRKRAIQEKTTTRGD